MAYETLLYDQRNAIGYVTLNRPEKLNALNHTVMEELFDCFQALRKDEEVRVVILTGSGEKAFVAGADINELAHNPGLNNARAEPDVTGARQARSGAGCSALEAAGCFPRRLHGRQEQRDESANNGDHHQKFDERKALCMTGPKHRNFLRTCPKYDEFHDCNIARFGSQREAAGAGGTADDR